MSFFVLWSQHYNGMMLGTGFDYTQRQSSFSATLLDFSDHPDLKTPELAAKALVALLDRRGAHHIVLHGFGLPFGMPRSDLNEDNALILVSSDLISPPSKIHDTAEDLRLLGEELTRQSSEQMASLLQARSSPVFRWGRLNSVMGEGPAGQMTDPIELNETVSSRLIEPMVFLEHAALDALTKPLTSSSQSLPGATGSCELPKPSAPRKTL